jgi:hypothetical protein
VALLALNQCAHAVRGRRHDGQIGGDVDAGRIEIAVVQPQQPILDVAVDVVASHLSLPALREQLLVVLRIR